jgi:hypothetical protein
LLGFGLGLNSLPPVQDVPDDEYETPRCPGATSSVGELPSSKPRVQIAWFSATFSAAQPSALVAQWIEHRFPKPGVAGSIPAGGTE